MSLFNKILRRGDDAVADLTAPYRTLLVGQTSPVVRGVILHVIASLDDLKQFSDVERTLLGKKAIEGFKKQLAIAQQQQTTYTTNQAALSSIIQAVNFIVIKSAGETFHGENLIIRGHTDSDDIKKAAMCYAFCLLIFMTLLAAFIQAGVISSEDKEISSGEWKGDLLSTFTFASTEQKEAIFRLGTKMFNGLRERQESNVVEFLENLEQLTLLTAINWEGKKTPDEVMLGLFKQKANVLLGALS